MNEKKKIGRPELPVEEKMINYTIRILPSQKVKAELLGGGKWIRRKIDHAKVK